MPMESKLAKLIDLAEIVTDIREQTEDTPIVLRHTIEQLSQTVAIVCSQVEPINMVLPLNVLWLCFKIESPYYKKAFKRVAKTNTTNTFPFEQEWSEIYFFNAIEEIQFFDAQDIALFDIPEVPLATSENLGKTKVNVDPEVPVEVTFVGSSDPAMSDDRTPLPHVHLETPASKLQSGANILTISEQSNPQAGQTLIYSTESTIEWAKITETSIEEGGYRE